MKKIVLSMLVIALTAASVNAQENQSPKHGMKKKHQHDMGLGKLNLSEDQKAKMKNLNEDYRKGMQDLKKQDNITVKEWKSRKEKLRKDHSKDIQGLLTNDQKEQFKKMKEDRKGQFKGRSGDKMGRGGDKMGRGGDRMEGMKERLGLTNEQSNQLKTFHTEMNGKMKAIKENTSLTPEQKKEQVKELMKNNKEKMKSILTEEQLKKLKEGKQKGSRKTQTL